MPAHGDEDEGRTFEGIGRIVSEWEYVELELGHLYTVLVDRFGDIEALQEYGSGGLFSQRVSILVRAQEQCFHRTPHQALEGEFDELIQRIRKYADRRHDVAHGIVKPIQWVFPPGDARRVENVIGFQYCVVPPHYKDNHLDPNNLPLYLYTYEEMLQIQGAMHGAMHEVSRYKWKLRQWIEDKQSRP
jgi:hypothetical protein